MGIRSVKPKIEIELLQMNERFATLLGKTGLEYRCLNGEESTEEVLEKLNSPIDWDHVDAILEEWRTYSGNWLKQALEK